MKLNKDVKAILFDVDKTLVDRNCLMSDDLKRTLVSLKNNGYLLGINSGRPVFSSLKVLDKNKAIDLFEIFYGCNGLEFYDLKKKRSTFLKEIDINTVLELNKIFHEDYLELAFYKNDKVLCLNHYIDDKQKIEEWAKVRFVKPLIIDFTVINHSIPKLIVLFKKDFKKEVTKKINTIKNTDIDLFFSGDECLEIVPKGINKGTSIIDLSKKLAIDPKNILAIGDAENDLPALCLATGVFVGEKRNDVEYSCQFKDLANFLNELLLSEYKN